MSNSEHLLDMYTKMEELRLVGLTSLINCRVESEQPIDRSNEKVNWLSDEEIESTKWPDIWHASICEQVLGPGEYGSHGWGPTPWEAFSEALRLYSDNKCSAVRS